MKALPVSTSISSDDSTYLWDLAKDTWQCIDYFTASETGFPYDSDRKPDTTNTTNIGLYLTSLCAAYKMGFISHEEAVQKVKKIIDSLYKIQHWHGFFHNHLSVTGKTEAQPGASAISDFNKLPAGLIVVRQTFPELKESCSFLLDRIEWNILYDEKKNVAYAGIDIQNQKVLPWTLGMLAADTRMACFLMIASGKVPASTWNNLNRDTDTHYGLSIMKPGWMGGGLFMHGICGLFLDERYTPVGKFMADFAYVQMLYSQVISSPVWGWSSCESPDGGYLGWGYIPHHVITPHASAMTIKFYPKKVIDNFKELEKLGARQPFVIDGKEYHFGFRDSIDIETNKSSPGYLTALDQGMLFLSLANYLQDGLIWNLFQSDSLVQNGLRLIPDYQNMNTRLEETYRLRDETPVLVNRLRQERLKALELNKMIIPSNRYKSLNGKIKKIKDKQFDTIIQHTYNSPTSIVRINLTRYDLTDYNALEFWMKVNSDSWPPPLLQLQFWGKDNGGIYTFQGITDEWHKIVIPFYKFGPKFTNFDGRDTYWDGWITNWKNPKQLDFQFMNSGDILQEIQLADVQFTRLDHDEIKNIALDLRKYYDTPVSSEGIIDNFNSMGLWSSHLWPGTTINTILEKENNQNSLRIDYDLNTTGQWVAIEKEFYYTLPDDYLFQFKMKGEGSSNTLEFKLIDQDGSTFIKRFQGETNVNLWKLLTISNNDLEYGWGGDHQLDRIKSISIAISCNEGGKGTVYLDDLKLIIPDSGKEKANE